MSELEEMAEDITRHIDKMWHEVHKQPLSSMAVEFHDAVGKPWLEAAENIRALGFTTTIEEKKRLTSSAISRVMRTVDETQRQAWVAQNILEGLKRGDPPLTLAQNMESAGVIGGGTLTRQLRDNPRDADRIENLAITTNWMVSSAKKVVLLMAKALERIIAVVATLARPRIGLAFGVIPSIHVDWDMGDPSAKELIDAMLKGFA